jgi:small subunit ribosomal protein S2
LGGTLTNFATVNKSILRLNELVNMDKSGEISKFTKKEQIMIQKDIDKLIKFVGGITTMRKLPDAIIIVDPKSEINAVMEAKKLKIPTIGLTNTNGSPSLTDLTIPINTNSNRTITLIIQLLADAACEARGEPTIVAHKPDSEIILVEEKRAFASHNNRTNHRRGVRTNAYVNKFKKEKEAEKPTTVTPTSV